MVLLNGTKRALHLGFLLMGFSFAITQGVLIRELLVAFSGNELSIGLILGSWLLLEAAGSGCLGRLVGRWAGRASLSGGLAYAGLQVLLAFLLPVCLSAAYAGRRLAGAIPGEGVGPVTLWAASAVILLPLALVDGAMYTVGCHAYATVAREHGPSGGRVYVLEAIGGVVGGIALTHLLIPGLSSLQTVLFLSVINLLSAALIAMAFAQFGQRPSLLLAASLVLLLCALGGLGFLLSPASDAAQWWIARQRWTGHDLLYSQNSVYGNVAIVRSEEQYTYYADGLPVLTAPVPDVVRSEEMVHLPLLYVAQPRRVLVLGGGAGGVLQELLKYPLGRIDYAELDPLLIEAILEYPTPLTAGELGDPRVRVERVDGRLLVRRKRTTSVDRPQERYDLILVNLPYPSTLQLNRFYTVEFYVMTRELLAEDGFLVTGCPGTLTYVSEELRDLNASLYHTLEQVYPYVVPVPGDHTLWLASSSAELSKASVESLVARWEGRGLEARLLTLSHIRLKLDKRRRDWFWASIDGRTYRVRGESTSATMRKQVNRDLHPVGLLYGLAYWNALYSPGLARAYARVDRLTLWRAILPLAAVAVIALTLVRRTVRGKSAVIPIAIATTGFAGMAADLLIVLSFQCLYGYVYGWIGSLIAAFMGGVALGGLLVTRRLSRGKRVSLLWLEGGLVLYCALLPAILGALYKAADHPWTPALALWVLLALNGVAGALVGSQFPLANVVWPGERFPRPGVLYACDLAGAFLGAVVVSVILVPALGILTTCLLMAILKSASLVLVAALPAPG
jgi:spermidine synthase